MFKEQCSCSLKPFSKIFADIPASGSSFFRLVKTKFLSNLSSWLLYTDFKLITNRVLLFRAFYFCCRKALLKLSANSFSSILSVPNSGKQFFRLVEMDFLSNAIHSNVWKQTFFLVILFRAIFVLVETIIQIKVEPFLIKKPVSYYWKPFSVRFLHIYSCRWKQFFGIVKTYLI